MNYFDEPSTRGKQRASEDAREQSISCRDLTVDELRSMRLSGCRTRHQTHEQDDGILSTSPVPDRRHSAPSALETSLAILDRMAHDTAAAATLNSEPTQESVSTPSRDAVDRFETFILTSRETPRPMSAPSGSEIPKNLVEISHRNHDFQHILSLAQKEALLKLNVRQVDDDDEEEDALCAPRMTADPKLQHVDSAISSTTRRRGNEPIGTWRFPSLGCAKEAGSEESTSRSTTLNNHTDTTVAYTPQADGKLSIANQADKNERELANTGNTSLSEGSERLARKGAAAEGICYVEKVTPLITTNFEAKKVEHDFGFTRNMELVYAAHVKNILKLSGAFRSTTSDMNRSKVSSSTSGSQKIGRSFGYYSFGRRVSLSHPNRLSIKETPQLLSTSNVHGAVGMSDRSTLIEGVAAGDDASIVLRDAVFVARVKANPLLQTTVFYERLYHSLQPSTAPSPGAPSTHFTALALNSPSSGGELNEAASAPNTEDTLESTPRSDAASALHSKASRESQNAPTTTLPKRYYRTLTPATRLVRHVHNIDNFEREVDNETNDLVVYVGMRLMGWLEVVSLLGQGGFGQVFLCRDLRISDGHFVHPKDIEGEDFSYWNCSHAYLPFGEASLTPTSEPLVAVKVVKSLPLFESQSVLEAEMLVLLGGQTADHAVEKTREGADGAAPPTPDARCRYVATVLADGICYGHHCIVMDRYGANLYEYFAKDHKGIPMYQIRSIGRQMFSALSLLHQCHIIHADIKPENILLTLDSCRSCVSTNCIAEGTKQASASFSANKVHNPLAAPSLESSYITLTRASVAGELPVLHHNVAASEADAGKSLSRLLPSQCTTTTALDVPQPRRMHPLNQRSDRPLTKVSRMDETGGGGDGKDAQEGSAPTKAARAPALQVKLIDFSSSCYEGGPLHTYIQSRYYRAPEAILQSGYGTPIDMWSSGCVLAELLLGLPLLPGCNEHHQLALIEEAIGPLPDYLLAKGQSTGRFYKPSDREAAPVASSETDNNAAAAAAQTRFQLRAREDFLSREGLPADTNYQHYFAYKAMRDLIRHCPLSQEEKRMSFGLPPYSAEDEDLSAANCAPSQAIRTELLQQRFLFYDLLRGLLNPDPSLRPVPDQVLRHAFFTCDIAYEKLFSLS